MIQSKRRIHFISISLSLGLLFSGLTQAHDTNTTHPRLTIAAGTLIKNADDKLGAYYDLWKTDAEIKDDKGKKVIPYLWGQDPRFSNEEDKEADYKADYPKFRHDLKNTLDGVVMEDTPTGRVYSHFQHAYTGDPMHIDWAELWHSDGSFIDLVAENIEILVGYGGALYFGKYEGKIERSEDVAKRYFYDSVEINNIRQSQIQSKRTSQSLPRIPCESFLVQIS